MAALHHASVLFLALLLLISPSHSLTCTSQTFVNNKRYATCTDLPTLGAYLHWTYDAAKSSLSVAFLAPPANPDGWIAWAINPTGIGMVGSQALIAFKQADGSMSVGTYNISAYDLIVREGIALDVTDKSAESSGGLMKIFATLTLPANTNSVNQVWQVDGSVKNGAPGMHDNAPVNLHSMGALELVRSVRSTSAAPPSNSNGTGGGASSTPRVIGTVVPQPAGGGSTGRYSSFGVFMILIFLGSFLFCF